MNKYELNIDYRPGIIFDAEDKASIKTLPEAGQAWRDQKTTTKKNMYHWVILVSAVIQHAYLLIIDKWNNYQNHKILVVEVSFITPLPRSMVLNFLD